MARRFGRLDTGQRGPARGLLEQFSGPHGGVRRLQRPGACPKPVPRGVLTSGAAAGPVPLRWGMPVGWRADLHAERTALQQQQQPEQPYQAFMTWGMRHRDEYESARDAMVRLNTEWSSKDDAEKGAAGAGAVAQLRQASQSSSGVADGPGILRVKTHTEVNLYDGHDAGVFGGPPQSNTNVEAGEGSESRDAESARGRSSLSAAAKPQDARNFSPHRDAWVRDHGWAPAEKREKRTKTAESAQCMNSCQD